MAFPLQNSNRFVPRSRKALVKKISIALLVLTVIGLPVWLFSRRGNGNAASTSNLPKKESVKGILSTTEVGREILIPLNQADDDTVNNTLVYRIESAEERNEIIVKGQTQTAIPGRKFLILNLKLTNNLNKGLEINTRDYIRLQINGTGEWLAPDIHNDPVEVQAISTKFTRVGFPLFETDRSFTIRLGEISGEKVEIPLEI